jgi:hypothetical protein
VRAGRIHQDRKRSPALFGFAGEPVLYPDYRRNLVQHFGDADHRYFVIIRDQFDARLGHTRPAHAEERRGHARAYRFR